MVLAPGGIHPVIGFVAILAIAVGAGASGALNMWYDADLDARMARTRERPIPAGRVTPGEALGFGLVLAVGSVVVLGLVVNWLSAALLAFTIFFYVVVYTMWLKRRTPQNIVIGGVAGPLPPVVAWAAVPGIRVESLSSSSSSSCGRRRISGRWRFSGRTTMARRACRCSPMSPASPRPSGRS
jgi:protoheme IX farnesyltransferase